MAYAEIRLDKMHGTDQPADLVSVKFYNGSTPADIENGNVVALNGLLAGEREVYKGVAPTAATAVNEVVLVATPELIYDETLRKSNSDFINPKDVPARGYRLRSGDIFSVTDAALSGRANFAAVTVGDVVELQAGTKLKAVETTTSGSTAIGKVISKENGKWIVIEVA